MERNSPTRLAFLLLLLPVFSCFLTGSSGTVMAQQVSTPGSLQFVNATGSPAGECPLKHTQVKAEISGFLSRVTVTQQFENTFPDKIEAVYTFPLPPAAAVDDMTIVVGNRTIKGKIMRREDAQATYDAARARGQVAALLHQQRPNIFRQSVANILPGQQIQVTISYIETLKYDDGSYEWSFPMVVAPRYIPESEAENESAPAASAAPEERVPDAAQISSPVMPAGMRAGHDISIEITLDAGVPLIHAGSQTHAIEVLQPDVRRAVLRLKDQATIPNQDFVLKYEVAGRQIADGVLAHHAGRGGFFTLILQPPDRVTAEDVMPKELVFVLDTSGSMEGFPLEKAKQTMALALDNLYPQDTFNVITFAGDTKILFPEPVPATPENLRRARKLLAQTKSEGGTEMMKAIRAALEPSDSQAHVRITCFLTDGVVYNDAEIIAEVQKHPNARVFAMGFGSSPNRFLLDKITEYGRGEVEYIAETGDTSQVAKRFHERVRNPLLTDVTVEWEGLPVTDVYPKVIPDLFSSKPVILSGRYAAGGKGIIRLKGRMSGREFTKEIPVELPGAESQHDVLATLWARRKVDDLMGQDMKGIQTGKTRDDLREGITRLGLDFRMMTQFTSFVAVEDSIVTDGVEPRRVEVPVEAPASAGSAGGVFGTVNVTNSSSVVNSTSASVSSVETLNLPMQSRSLQSLLTLAPGTASRGAGQPIVSEPINISVNGQRPSSNSFIVDGVSANFGIAPGGQSPGASAGGGMPALTATGATNSLASAGATAEVAIHTYYTEAEYGRAPGSQVSIVTKSGTNEFHGSLFYYFGHEALDANDWFANSRGLSQPPHRFSDFGGTIGGPIKRNQAFFFASYEGLRLRQPVVALTDVPSLSARRAAPTGMAPLLNLYPLPSGPARPDGFAEFASSFANAGRHDAVSLRVDDNVTSNLTLRARYSHTNSTAAERGAGGFSLNTLNRISNRARTITGTALFTLSPRVIAEVHANYSRLSVGSSFDLDDFGGATLPPDLIFSQPSLFAQNGSFSADLNGRSTNLMSGSGVASTQHQLNTLGAITMVYGHHTVKFGADYRRMSPVLGMRQLEQSILFDGVTQALTGQAARIGIFRRAGEQHLGFNNLSLYGQDQIRVTPDLTLTFGLRWEVSPAPVSTDGDALTITQFSDPALLNLAGPGPRQWSTTFGNLAPRISFAYQLSNGGNFVVRGGLGVHYDVSNSAAGDTFADSFPFLTGGSVYNVPFSFNPVLTSNSTTPINVPLSVFNPNLKLPYTVGWNLGLESALGYSQSVAVAYVGTAGRRLLFTQTLFNPNQSFALVRLTNNDAASDHHALQVQFNRRFSRRLGAMVSYTLAKSLDNFSQDTANKALLRNDDPRLERGPSDFDVRHTLAGFVAYHIPAPFQAGYGNTVLRNWEVSSTFDLHSAAPLNVVYEVPTSYGVAYLRPDLIAGVPLYLSDAGAAGGWRINPAAFSVPQGLSQGTLGRNALRGFSLSQVNLALRRQFNLAGEMGLIVGMEATNIFNHPNFATPIGSDGSLGARFDPTAPLNQNPTFGQARSMSASSPEGTAGSSFGPSYYPGGARSIKMSLKLQF